MKTFSHLLLVLLASLWPYFSQAQPASEKTARQIDSIVAANLPKTAPGCVVLIAKEGTLFYHKAYGLADINKKTPMQMSMLFRTGSMGKQYTAIAVLQLVEKGRIRLQDSIQVYVKDFPHKVYPVTIENLLNHTSGIIDFQVIQNPDPAKVHDHYTPKQGVDYFKDEPLLFKPGTTFQYSNSNYYLLGYIIEQVTGQPFGKYLQQHILGPAQLTSTFYIPGNPMIRNMTPGYSRFDGKNWENAELEDTSILYSAGGLAATTEDVWKWHKTLQQGTLLSKPMLTRAYTPAKLENGKLSPYGYGWYIKNIDGLKTIEHSGSTDGYQTDEIWVPEKDLFIVTLFNGFEADMDWQSVTNEIARTALELQRKDLKLDSDSLNRFVGTYTFSTEHQLVISFTNDTLFVEATNPKAKLPRLPLHAESPYLFYIKEAPLKFEFVWEEADHSYKIITYNTNGKDAEWKKTK
ncbi:MAG: serine hydrolase domain-containing protein [Chitinophagaceae bacterium]